MNHAHKISSDGAAAVAPDIKWLRIDEHTPRGVKMLLISKQFGIAQIGSHKPYDGFFSHWHPLPTFTKD